MGTWAISYTLADLIEHADLGGGVHGPARRTATNTPDGNDPAIELDFVVQDGEARCEAVRLTGQNGGREVRATDLTDLRLEAIAEHVLSAVTTTKDEVRQTLTIDGDLDASTRARPHVQRARRAARRRLTDQDLDLVRRVYRSALANGENTAEAVAKQFGIRPRTAGDYIKRARDRKFLGPSLGRGKPGERTDPPTDTTTKG